MSSVAYIGEDINDLPCMNVVKKSGGLVGCPADAVQSVRNVADFISCKNGGDGAVREFIELILNAEVDLEY
jgi:3-deoxy-D-manno-octulosonate 8-phosphate phosphatase (KDO 8-P phosphatase)